MAAARSLARVVGSVAALNSVSKLACTHGPSHILCLVFFGVGGGGWLYPLLHKWTASGIARSGVLRSLCGTIWLMRGEQPAADAKKADGVSCVALRTLIPRYEQVRRPVTRLSRCPEMLRTVLRMEQSLRSKSSRHGDRKHGAVLRVYNTLGVAMQWRSRRIASCLLRRHSLDPMTFKELTLSVIAALMETTWPIRGCR